MDLWGRLRGKRNLNGEQLGEMLADVVVNTIPDVPNIVQNAKTFHSGFAALEWLVAARHLTEAIIVRMLDQRLAESVLISFNTHLLEFVPSEGGWQFILDKSIERHADYAAIVDNPQTIAVAIINRMCFNDAAEPPDGVDGETVLRFQGQLVALTETIKKTLAANAAE